MIIHKKPAPFTIETEEEPVFIEIQTPYGLTFLKESSEIDAANFFPTSNFELTILSFLGL